MNPRFSIGAFFYAMLLAYGSIVIPIGDLSLCKIQSSHIEVESSDEKVAAPDQLVNLNLVNQVARTFQSYSRVYHFPTSDHFFYGYVSHYLYWKSFYARILYFSEAVIIQFGPTDIVFPFHQFW